MRHILLGMAFLIAATSACGRAPDRAEPDDSEADRAQPSATATSQTAPEQRLAFVSNREGVYRLYTMDPDGGDVRKVSDQPVAPWPFSVSQDGTQIVAWEGQNPVSGETSPAVYRIDVVGGKSQLLGEVPLQDDGPLIMPPRWQKDDDAVLVAVGAAGVCYSVPSGGGDVREESPDKCVEAIVVGEGPGESLAAIAGISLVMTEARYTEGRELDQVMSIKTQGGEAEVGEEWKLIGLGAMQSMGVLRPVWSPDGKWIAYVDFDADDGQSGIAVIPAEGGDSRLLVPAAADSSVVLFPRAWSADGKRVIFAEMEEASAIQDVSLDGSDVRTLVGGDGYEYRFPQWVTVAPAPERLASICVEGANPSLMCAVWSSERERTYL
jgi:dipeptidyl aminopeptidase/acylaminoacyl peptidase